MRVFEMLESTKHGVAALARESGLSPSVIYAWRLEPGHRDHRQPTPEQLRRVADALDRLREVAREQAAADGKVAAGLRRLAAKAERAPRRTRRHTKQEEQT